VKQFLTLFLLVSFAFPLIAQISDAPARLIAIAKAAKTAKSYSFEGEVQLAFQRGANPGPPPRVAKIKFAVAEPNQYSFTVERDGVGYSTVTNGTKTWTTLKGKKEFLEEEGELSADNNMQADDDEQDWAFLISQQVVPLLQSFLSTQTSVDGRGEPEQIKFQGKKQAFGALKALYKRDDEQHYFQLMIPVQADSSNSLARLEHTEVSFEKETRIATQMRIDFKSLEWNKTFSPDEFVFTPPTNYKKVEYLDVPGKASSFLLGKPAPDFELKSFDGEKVKLSDLRGKYVMLNFWASWCGPCRREMPGLMRAYEEFKPKGLILYGINNESYDGEKGKAKKFINESLLTFPTLDDAARKAGRLYKVQAIPTSFLIDPDGNVVRYIRGSRSERELRQIFEASIK
jgi:peroxiredoxin/outer membrane lipoprotein-sorting protein